jgi:lipopolysaccharide cholinephosphotransferase
MELTSKELRKVQLLELKILVEIKRICDKHGISFVLIEGTLLGAIRHKGFIPWDDDIDIGMTRENFEKFCRVAHSELTEEYFLQTPYTDSQYYDYCKALIRLRNTKFLTKGEPIKLKNNGIFVDIFPFDSIPDSYCSGLFYWGLFNTLFRVYIQRKGYRPNPKNIFARFIMHLGVILCLFIPTNKLEEILNKYYKKYEYYENNFVIMLKGGWGFKKGRHLRSTISEIIYMPFEGILMPVPKDYNLYLNNVYGNYMILPPEESRKLRHAVEIDFGSY